MNQLLDRCTHIAELAASRARELNLNVSIVCVDKGGHIVFARRTDLAGYPTLEVARRKAATSAVMGMPTGVIANFVGGDPLAATAIANSPDMLAVPGGAPIMVNSSLAGGIGIAGGHYTEDQAILDHALQAAGAAAAPVTADA